MGWGKMGENVEIEEEIELSLELSIGGTFRKTKEKAGLQRSLCSNLNAREIKVAADSKDAGFARSGGSVVCDDVNLKELNSSGVDAQKGGEFLEQQRKRELHAFRRQEARKKREEKQQMRGICTGRNGVFMDDKLLLEAQEFATRVRDRAVKENEVARSEGCCRKSKKGSSKKEDQQGTVGLGDCQTLTQSQSPNHQENKPRHVFQTQTAFSVVPMQYPFQLVPNRHHHPPPYVSFDANGLSFPSVMPCWVDAPPATESGSANRNPAVEGKGYVFQPVPCRKVRCFQPSHASYDSEQKGNKGGGGGGVPVMKLRGRQSSPASTGSPDNSSSAVFNNHSSSPQGGSSNDTRSHSIRSHRLGADRLGQLDHSASSPQTVGADRGVEEEEEEEATEKSASPNMAQSSSPQKTVESNSESISTANKNPKPALEEDGNKGEAMRTRPCLPQIPCVSTTGNGPNGKTITGFLYRYTQSDVSIVCVCHGNSFSPAEFVKHAGGTDISHPLKHIVVVPSAF